jgi:hypothetical protein
MNRPRHDGTLDAAILRALAAAPGGVLTTTGLLAVGRKPHTDWADPMITRQRMLAHLGNNLRAMVKAGLVEKAGVTTDVGWQNCPVIRWRITLAGRDLIAWWADPARLTEENHQTRVVARRAERQYALAERRILLDKAAALHGHRPPRIERQQAALGLREAGCTLRQIGDALGVTAECIRLDVISPPYVPRLAHYRSKRMAELRELVSQWRKTALVLDSEHSAERAMLACATDLEDLLNG